MLNNQDKTRDFFKEKQGSGCGDNDIPNATQPQLINFFFFDRMTGMVYKVAKSNKKISKKKKKKKKLPTYFHTSKTGPVFFFFFCRPVEKVYSTKSMVFVLYDI